jgi:hypothetical protein
MLTKVSALMGTTVAIALVVVALWGWGAAEGLVRRADDPRLALWAVRSASIAALAAAQVLGLTFLADAFRGRDRAGEIMRLGAGLVCTIALISATVLGIAGR